MVISLSLSPSCAVRAYDNHAKCGLVWIPHVVAYRCRTCGISPCMSICRDCFKRGNHQNHDFNMFLSQAGGACDCGDTSVMKAEGFCSDHGLNNCQNKAPVPDDLMLVAEAMMPRLILRMLLHFREYSASNLDSDDCHRTAEYCNDYCAMLMEFNNMGELMRRVMTRTLIDRGVYRRLLDPPYPSPRYGKYIRDGWLQYEEALRQFPSPEPPPDYAHLAALGRTIVHETLLEEFIFWTFKYEFQQQIVCFLLNMLPDQDYKEHLTRTFVMHYCRIPSVLELSSDPDTLSNRVVHMSVQLFSNESLALKMVEELSLLHVMIISLRQMMSKILTPHTLHTPEHNFHYVVDCAERVMKEHCYWPLVSDFNNVLSHESVALVFLKDDDLIDMWFQFLSMLQGKGEHTHTQSSNKRFNLPFSSPSTSRNECKHSRNHQPCRVRVEFLLCRLQLRARGERLPDVVDHLAPAGSVPRAAGEEDHDVLRELSAGLARCDQLLPAAPVREGKPWLSGFALRKLLVKIIFSVQ